MASVTLQNGKLHFGRQSLPLISGEFHYFRIDPMYWNRILDSIEEMGLKFIATYVCWDFHQVGKEKYDFLGKTNPRRNLKAFLDLTRKRGFKVFIRPGPYIYSEWKNLGIPDDAAVFPRFSEPFLKRAFHYMKAVCKVIKPYLATNGGHIVLFQADNEIDLMAGGFEKRLGLTGHKGAFQEYLKEKYQSIDLLNRHWNSDYHSFKNIKAVTDWPFKNEFYWRRYYDYRDFARHYTNQKAEWMVQAYKKIGINVPIVLNTYSEYEVQNFYEMEKIADLAGVDVYPENEFHAGPQSHRLFTERLRAVAGYSKAPYIVEFESGLWHGFVKRVKGLTPRHYKLCALTALSAGMVGWNWYMLVNRDNWYQAPITELGNFRVDLEPVFKEMVQFYKGFDPAENQKCTQVGALFSFAHYRMGMGYREDRVLQSLYQADIDYEFFHLADPKKIPKVLFYSGEEWLTKLDHFLLKDYVEKGGTLVFFQKIPLYDEELRPYNLLEIPLPEAVIGGREVMTDQKEVILEWSSKLKTPLKSELFLYEPKAGKPLWARQAKVGAWEKQWKQVEGEKYCVGSLIKRGKGQILLLGVHPSPQVMTDCLNFLSVPQESISHSERVQSALFKRKKKNTYFLIIINQFDQPSQVRISLPQIKKITALKSFSNISAAVSHSNKGVELHLELPAKSGDILRFGKKA